MICITEVPLVIPGFLISVGGKSLFLPRRIGHKPPGLSRKLYAEGFANTHFSCPLGKFRNPDPFTRFIKKDVITSLDRFNDVDHSLGFPVLHEVPVRKRERADGHDAMILYRSFGRDRTFL